MFALFPAQLSEVDVCYALIDKGRAFQRNKALYSGRMTIRSENTLPTILKPEKAMR